MKSPFKISLPLLAIIVCLSGCDGGGIDGTGTGMVAPTTNDPLMGLESCDPQTEDQSLLCGRVTTSDGVTPVIGAEVRIDTGTASSFIAAPSLSRGVESENNCITDSQGDYACVLPSNISGQTIFIVSASGLALKSFTVEVQTGEINNVETQLLNPDLGISLVDNSSTLNYVASACDSLPVISTVASTERDAPEPLVVGMIAEANIGRPQDDNGTHYWSAEVTAGVYHLVVDPIVEVGDRLFGVGIYASIRVEEESEFLDVINDISSYWNWKLRSHAAINISKNMTVQIRIKGTSLQPEKYRIGLFEQSMDIPTPYFTDCPQVVGLSFDSVESFSLSRSEEHWFSIDAQPGTYDIIIDSRRLDMIWPIAYRVDALRSLAQNSSAEILSEVFYADGLSHTVDASVVADRTGAIYLRFLTYPYGTPPEMEIRVNKR